MCRNDGIGRRAGLKIRWWRHRAGSTPASGTDKSTCFGECFSIIKILFFFFLYTKKYFRRWRSWITQQIPILKNGGSNPFRRARIKSPKTSLFCEVRGFFFLGNISETNRKIQILSALFKYNADISFSGFAVLSKKTYVCIPQRYLLPLPRSRFHLSYSSVFRCCFTAESHCFIFFEFSFSSDCKAFTPLCCFLDIKTVCQNTTLTDLIKKEANLPPKNR